MTTLKRWNGTDWEYVGLPTNVGMSPQTIGYSEALTNTTGIVGSNVDLTGYTVTVTVPEGRRIRISTRTYWTSTVTSDEVYVAIFEGGTQISEERKTNIGGAAVVEFSTILSPTAGTHTYRVLARRFAGSGTLTNNAWANGPGFILVEDITGSTLPYQPASVPVGVLGYAEMSANQGPFSVGPETPLNGLSVNVTVPAGRTLRISSLVTLINSSASQVVYTAIREGNTTLKYALEHYMIAGNQMAVLNQHIVSPSAGSHVYYTTLNATGGNLTAYADADRRSFMLVEDITATPAPANTAPSSTLGYAERVSDQNAIGAEVDLTGLSVTITVPAGRRVRLTAQSQWNNEDANGATALGFFKEGSTYLGRWSSTWLPGAGFAFGHGSIVISPSAGTHTYKLSAQKFGTGTMQLRSPADYPAYLLVEDITGVGVPGHTHTQLDDTGWISLVPYLVNGWVSYDNTYGPPRFRKKAGVVYVEGLVRSGTVGTAIATLPPGFRFQSGLPKLLFPSVGGEPTTGTRVDVESNGNIIHIGSLNGWYTLSGIIYPVD